MKNKKKLLTLISLLLVCVMAINLAGCEETKVSAAENLMEGIAPNSVSALDDLSAQNKAITQFAVNLFKVSNENGKNTLISPLSVLCALAMTANGAKSETLSQMESVLGITKEELNLYIYSYMNDLPNDEKYKLSLANSIWFTSHERFTANQNFLQTNADYFGADIYKAPFDNSTLEDINNWVNDKTEGMIPKILEQIPTEAVMYLVNALAFEAEWAETYKKEQVRDGEFTKEDGTKQDAEFMYSSENAYLEDENAAGFIKYYKNRKYAFVALLPNENISVSDYVATLDGAKLSDLLSKPQYVTVNTAIPKFETGYETEMSAVLATLGMPYAFSASKADFTNLGTSEAGNIYINRVLHKTYISVGEKGTKAGAVTVIEMNDECAVENPEKPKEVILDRPFVYMLIDCENNIPFFIGTLTEC